MPARYGRCDMQTAVCERCSPTARHAGCAESMQTELCAHQAGCYTAAFTGYCIGQVTSSWGGLGIVLCIGWQASQQMGTRAQGQRSRWRH